MYPGSTVGKTRLGIFETFVYEINSYKKYKMIHRSHLIQIHPSDFLVTAQRCHLPVSNIFQVIRDVFRHICGVNLEAIGIHDLSSSTYLKY